MNRYERNLVLLMFIPLAAIVVGCGKADQQDAAVSPSKSNRPWPTPGRHQVQAVC